MSDNVQIAVDLGASGGRVALGWLEADLELETLLHLACLTGSLAASHKFVA